MYKNLKTFKELKYNYVTFNIKDIKSVLEYNKTIENVSEFNLDLESFVIKIPLMDFGTAFGEVNLYVFVNNNVIEIYSYDRNKYEFKLDIAYDIFKIKKDNIDDSIIYCQSKILSLASKQYMFLVAQSLSYIIDKICNRKIIYKQIKNISKDKEKNNINNSISKKKNIEVIGDSKTIYFTIDNITNDEIKLLKRGYNRKVESWYVLPHTRTYKSGKVVQVKGYYKGDKDKASAKTYVL